MFVGMRLILERATGGFINIAKIFQSVVKALDKDEKDTVFSWKSFTVHSLWDLLYTS